MRDTRKNRTPEVHFYEWRATAWAMSSTREMLDSSGRGIYRELLDQCYTQGGFPLNFEWMARKCNCTQPEVERVWPLIRKYFLVSKKNSEWLTNAQADVYRREYFTYIQSQRDRRKKGIDKARTSIEMHNGGSTVVDSRNDLTQYNTIQDNTPKPPRSSNAEFEAWFAEFWGLYPRRKGKGAARKAAEKRGKTPEQRAKILAALRSQLPELAAKEQQFIPFPATWLNGERYEDEPESKVATSQPELPLVRAPKDFVA